MHRAEGIAQGLQYPPTQAAQVEIDRTALVDGHIDATPGSRLRAGELVQVETIG